MITLFFILLKVIGGKIGIAKAALLIAKSQALKALFYEFSDEILHIGQRALMSPSVQDALPGWVLDFLEEKIDDLVTAVEAIRAFLDSQ
ncbi:MAG: hypothetical protein DYG98_14100 [Haliscomenobacteraceae bacterium CHB4]|nr:hypothetical protein [Saprospiraceae bacterium]MCE7924177.1 hypothetical protein [Haliscomenobacteraceae bacterium CHB4]